MLVSTGDKFQLHKRFGGRDDITINIECPVNGGVAHLWYFGPMAYVVQYIGANSGTHDYSIIVVSSQAWLDEWKEDNKEHYRVVGPLQDILKGGDNE